jgi:hypothetical protein
LATAQQPAPLLRFLRFEGEGSLANADIVVAGWTPPGAAEATPLDSASMTVEGLLSSEFQFAGPHSSSPADAHVVTYRAPRRSQDAPGIDPQRLPRP